MAWLLDQYNVAHDPWVKNRRFRASKMLVASIDFLNLSLSLYY